MEFLNVNLVQLDASLVLHQVLVTLALKTHLFLSTDRYREQSLFVKENAILDSLLLLMVTVQLARLDASNARIRQFALESLKDLYLITLLLH